MSYNKITYIHRVQCTMKLLNFQRGQEQTVKYPISFFFSPSFLYVVFLSLVFQSFLPPGSFFNRFSLLPSLLVVFPSSLYAVSRFSLLPNIFSRFSFLPSFSVVPPSSLYAISPSSLIFSTVSPSSP